MSNAAPDQHPSATPAPDSDTPADANTTQATSVCLGTRGSQLALAQSQQVAHALESASATTPNTTPLSIALTTIRTQGDVDPTSLRELGGIGVFAASLRLALLHGEVDLAVHSYKDLPTEPVPGLRITAVPRREDPRDALCARDHLTLSTLPDGATVGTGSPRRAAQLLAVRPDLRIVDLRGNVPTRLARVAGLEHLATPLPADAPGHSRTLGDLDAVVLALSGLRRLNLNRHATQILDTDIMLPAPAQGALAVETRADVDAALPRLAQAAAALDDLETRLSVAAERALMRRLEAGCAAPVGALAEFDGDQFRLRALVASLDGQQVRRCERALPAAGLSVPDAERLGAELAQALLDCGAASIVDLHANKARRG